MKTYEVQWVRVEHQATLIEVQAHDKNEAHTKAVAFARSSAFDADDYDVVYADEFVNDINEVE